MASTPVLRSYRSLSNHVSAPRRFSTSATTMARLRGKLTAKQINDRLNEATKYFDDDDASDGPLQDTTAMGHVALDQQRQLLHYMRLIEHEVPQLVAFRKPFMPPPPAHPLIVRSISYGGEAHPACRKRTIVTSVALLPLKDDKARHRLKVLAGPRWTPEPPKDAGLGKDEDIGKHGFVKISCEDFPEPAMNLKWASDALDRLIVAANNSKNEVAEIPLDTRHLDAKARKAKKGEHVRGRGSVRPSLRDFPKEWLPTLPTESEQDSSTQ